MSRQPAQVRDAVPDDVDALHQLCADSGLAREVSARAVADAETSIASLALSPDSRLLVLEQAGRLVAMMQLHRAPISPLHLESVVHTSFLVVHPDFRRQGFAHVLMEAAVAWAEEKDAGQITVVTDSQSRETNRYFARLGMGTVATVRNASTSALRKKLAGDRGSANNRNLGQVLAARRTMRRRFSG